MNDTPAPTPAPATIRALSVVERQDDADALQRIAANARRAGNATVERAAVRRLAFLHPRHAVGTLENDCWAMVHAVEALRKLEGRRVWKMNRMRPKIARDGEHAALAYCALNKTDGFDEIVRYGTPELLAERIVLRQRDSFSADVIAGAEARLLAAGLPLVKGTQQERR